MAFYVQPTVEGKSFSVTTNLIGITSNSENVFSLFRNPSDSGLNALLVNLSIGSTAVDSLKTTIRVYENPTITSVGTLLIPTNMRIGSDNLAKCTVYKQPSVSNFGTLKFIRAFDVKGSSDGIKQIVMLEPGKDILVTLQNSLITTIQLHTDFNWLEGA